MVQTKEAVPESWEELEATAGSKNSPTDCAFGGPAEERPLSIIEQPSWRPLPPPKDDIPFVAGQTPYVPQVTKILARPSRPSSEMRPNSVKRDEGGPTASLTLEEKQRRYAEARKRIFTEGGK